MNKSIEECYKDYEENGKVTEINYGYYNGLIPVIHEFYEESEVK